MRFQGSMVAIVTPMKENPIARGLIPIFSAIPRMIMKAMKPPVYTP